uniref:Single-stranded DNA-binding protein n=1 Tax=viral metagenome TaxID=1070528 RepID=A0A6M3KND6_9ZZZZ
MSNYVTIAGEITKIFLLTPYLDNREKAVNFDLLYVHGSCSKRAIIYERIPCVATSAICDLFLDTFKEGDEALIEGTIYAREAIYIKVFKFHKKLLLRHDEHRPTNDEIINYKDIRGK